MTEQLVIIGCGGFGREVLGIVAAINARDARWSVAGYVDDGPREEDLALLKRLDVRHLGPLTELDSLDARAVIGIGSATARQSIDRARPQQQWATLIHPDTTIGQDVELSPGVVIAPGVRLSTHIRVGRHVHVDQNAAVGHDVELGDYSRLNPQACVSGNVSVGAGALIGANSTVLQGLSIGEGSTVGAGAVVVRDTGNHAVVKGVPAR
ncbi:NeuD/PglB/VioB family sugar acetyltransferase [Luteipulveratus mongoliensis]|uniref:Acetyltransferase n=1 Tax=Luteipulveratus mongoliensis TaxID=571913 RepID=A0A0K1JHC2_9MICO|nr:NeuD/PglB/VioB family sugar acetyltransferase [Luteipulveratus mongoliensis]AKU16109.1 acetyltransferase [Luteipulveratus mongoliensis]